MTCVLIMHYTRCITYLAHKIESSLIDPSSCMCAHEMDGIAYIYGDYLVLLLLLNFVFFFTIIKTR